MLLEIWGAKSRFPQNLAPNSPHSNSMRVGVFDPLLLPTPASLLPITQLSKLRLSRKRSRLSDPVLLPYSPRLPQLKAFLRMKEWTPSVNPLPQHVHPLTILCVGGCLSFCSLFPLQAVCLTADSALTLKSVFRVSEAWA